jgi:hypothetical protein
MTMITCEECKKEISDQAESCPHCGMVRPKKPSGCFVVVLAVIIFAVISAVYRSNTAPDVPAKTPFQIEQEAATERTFQAVVAVLQAIKKSAREPDSIAWSEIIANNSGTVICVDYRGKNGFGGVSSEQVVVVSGEIKQGKKDWNRHCVGSSMVQMKHAARAVR